ncbi:MAG TPA: thioredoxin domain-containing protein [Phycisphaerales bacterium]|nr:thioredoxin domain-containing protein [Phycisphaerales bacterium]
MSGLTIPVDAEDHAAGSSDAPVTLVEYGDYECPHCAAAHPVVKTLLSEMPSDLRFVFRNFPLTQIHEHAMLAAQAAEAAGSQGEEHFWRMHDEMLEHQDQLDVINLLATASDLGLDVSRFRTDLEASRFRPRVEKDFHGGVRSGVNGTPTFFINGVRHDGGFDEGSLRQAIRAAVGIHSGSR